MSPQDSRRPPRRLDPWPVAGLFLVALLAGYWYIDTHSFRSHPDRLRKLQRAVLATPEDSSGAWPPPAPDRLGRLQAARLTRPELRPSKRGEWPQWRGPNRDGLSPEIGLLPAWPADGPKVLWTAATGKGFSSL